MPVALEVGDVRRRPLVAAPCVILAAALHGALFYLALAMAMGASAPCPVIGISLLPAMGSGMMDRGDGPAGASPARVATEGPAVARRVEEVAASGGVQKPAASAPSGKESAKVRVATEMKRNDAAAAIRPRAKPRKPSPRSQVPAVTAPASPERDRVVASEDPGVEGKTSVTDLHVRHAGVAGAAEAMPSGASGVMGGQGLGGSGDGPVGASFGDADGPSFVRRVLPRYPERARRRGREGVVLLRLVIGPGGELRDAHVVEGGGHGFDEAALAAVRASAYAPAMREGRGVECAALLPIRFALKGS